MIEMQYAHWEPGAQMSITWSFDILLKDWCQESQDRETDTLGINRDIGTWG
jgi:hypothetical protein